MNENGHLLIIAVDGHSSCGKSTYAKRIARMLKYSDSGEGIKHPMSPCPLFRLKTGKYILTYEFADFWTMTVWIDACTCGVGQ